jgi:hypothetical protein
VLLDAAAQGGNWVAINPFAYMPAVNSPRLTFNRDRTMTRGDLKQVVADAHAAGLKVLLKPHIWSRDFAQGKWHGDIEMTSDADWAAWFAQYSDYIVDQASLAEQAGVDGFCIGLEYGKTMSQEVRWRAVIAEVRKVYRGPICYSAGFLDYDKVPFWDAVDVIGITAYFPLAEMQSPDEATIREGWRKVLTPLEAYAARVNKGVVFTELGYTESNRAAIEPWSYDVPVRDPALRVRLYRIALEEIAKRPWIKGVFLWKWFTALDWQQFEGHDEFGMQDHPELLQAVRQVWK